MKTSDLSCAFMGYIYENSPTYKATLIIIATLMITLSFPTFLLNMCIILSILRKPELHTPSFIVVLNLAISDCLAGFSAYIFYAIICIRFALGYNACPIAYIGTPWAYVLAINSFYTTTLQTAERYLAIFFPYWYHEKVTVKRTSMAALSTWSSSIGLVVLWLLTKDNQIFHGAVGSSSIIFFSITITCYIRIFQKVRSIEKEIATQQTASTDHGNKIKSESKVAKATLIILVAVVACYLPGLSLHFYFAFFGEAAKSSSKTHYWVWLVGLLSSFVNPLIACRQLTVLRRPVIGILLVIFPCFKRNHVTP